MGYELNRLMKQYGVATPSLAAPPPPLAEGATEEQKAAQAADMLAYDKYRNEYMNRLNTVPMYGQRQYNTTFAPVNAVPAGRPTEQPQVNPVDTLPELYERYLGRAPDQPGLEYWNQQLASGVPFSEVYNLVKTSPEAQKYTPNIAPQPQQQSFDPMNQAAYGNVPASNVVRNAYQQLGRQGFGTAASQIDIPGYQYWMEQSKAMSPEQLNAAMLGSFNASASANPNDPNVQYTQGYQNLQNTGSFYNDTLKAPVYTYAPPPPASTTPASPAQPTPDQYAELQKQIAELRNEQQNYIPSIHQDSGGYAKGGLAKVKKYAAGGEIEAPEEISVPVPEAPLTAMAEPAAAPVEAAPVEAAPMAPAEPAAPEFDRTLRLQEMLNQYGPQSGGYGAELAAARERHKAESEAFTQLLNKHLESPESDQNSKAEMYFRLAAAFGSPTKTGSFGEHLGMAGRELAGHAQGRRESAAKKRDLMLSAQQLKMGAAKEDFATVRALEAESMKDRRAIAQEMIKEYIASGKPQSEAGRRAKDMGLKPGTPEYQQKVEEFANLDTQNKMNQINAQLTALNVTQENIKLKQDAAARLSPAELKMRVESEDLIASGSQALKDLQEAYRLNPNTFAGGWTDAAQRTLLEAAGSKDPKVVNTRVLENLLGAQGLSKLRATFGGNPTEGERAILMDLEGIGSKTVEERGRIIRRAYQVLQDRVAREQRRLDDIKSGSYRMTEPLPEQGAE